MYGNQVSLQEPGKEKKEFAFHRCYWSTDDSLGVPPVDNKYLFEDIGK
jgi:hypothetical protein